MCGHRSEVNCVIARSSLEPGTSQSVNRATISSRCSSAQHHDASWRCPWREVAEEVERLLLDGVPIHGVCLYPILGMPEWHDPDIWTRMGLWDPVCHHDPCGERLICEPMLEALQSVRHVDELHHAV